MNPALPALYLFIASDVSGGARTSDGNILRTFFVCFDNLVFAPLSPTLVYTLRDHHRLFSAPFCEVSISAFFGNLQTFSYLLHPLHSILLVQCRDYL